MLSRDIVLQTFATVRYNPANRVGLAVGSMAKLTARAAATITKPGRHSDGDGLYLNVSEAGAKSWRFMWKRDGKRREMGLGSFRHVSLQEAREKARAAGTIVRAGGDPIRERDRGEGMTFGEAADALIDSMSSSWRNEKHRAQWTMTLRDYCAAIRPRVVDSIGTEDVLKVLRPIWTERSETASRLRGRIEKVLDYARAKGMRAGENPARWRGHLDAILPKRQKLTRGHHKAMPYEDVPAFVERLRAAGSVSTMAIDFLILTAARSGEVLGARWEEIDLDKALWTVPAARMKAAREHRVPLTPRAVALLKQLYDAKIGSIVFPAPKGGRMSDMALTMTLRRMDIDATVHGFRSSFREWAGDRTAFPREVAEAALAHLVGDEVERAYRRGDALEKRRELMLAWESFIEARSANVTQLRRAGAGG